MKPFIAFSLSFFLSAPSFAETITVAATISMKDALGRIAEDYTALTGDTIQFTFGSSGQLAGQIRSGAPINLFISAANKQVEDLAKSGAIELASRRVVAGNSLVLVVPPAAKSLPTSLRALADPSVTRIAIGEPKSVPAGQYAEQAIGRAGVTHAVKDKLILGTNVRQVLDYVERGEVSAGLVYKTDAKAAGDKVRVTCTVSGSEHEPIVYPAVLVSASTKKAAAKKFLDFVLSDKGQTTLGRFGFAPPPQRTTPPTTQPQP